MTVTTTAATIETTTVASAAATTTVLVLIAAASEPLGDHVSGGLVVMAVAVAQIDSLFMGDKLCE
jgi:hypothetical protein